MCCQQGDCSLLSYKIALLLIQGTGKTSGNKIFLEHLAAVEKEEKAMHDKKVVGSSSLNKQDSAGDQEDEAEEVSDDDWSPIGSKKRRVKESRNKTKRKSVSDEGREDADYVERQMFHAKQV